MTKLTKQPVSFIIGVVVLAMVGGGITYFIIHKATGDTIQVKQVSQSQTPKTATKQIPQDAISPAQLVPNIRNYLNKKVKVVGVIGSGGSNNYFVFSGDGKSNTGVPLDFSKAGISPQEFVGKQSVVTGKLQQSGKTITLVVSSIE